MNRKDKIVKTMFIIISIVLLVAYTVIYIVAFNRAKDIENTAKAKINEAAVNKLIQERRPELKAGAVKTENPVDKKTAAQDETRFDYRVTFYMNGKRIRRVFYNIQYSQVYSQPDLLSIDVDGMKTTYNGVYLLECKVATTKKFGKS